MTPVQGGEQVAHWVYSCFRVYTRLSARALRCWDALLAFAIVVIAGRVVAARVAAAVIIVTALVTGTTRVGARTVPVLFATADTTSRANPLAAVAHVVFTDRAVAGRVAVVVTKAAAITRVWA